MLFGVQYCILYRGGESQGRHNHRSEIVSYMMRGAGECDYSTVQDLSIPFFPKVTNACTMQSWFEGMPLFSSLVLLWLILYSFAFGVNQGVIRVSTPENNQLLCFRPEGVKHLESHATRK